MSLRVERVLGVAAWRKVCEKPQRRFGVPPNGPWDTEATDLVCALLDLPAESEVFEILQGTTELKVEADGTLAVVGLDGRVDVNGIVHPLACRLSVSQGEALRIQAHCACLSFVSQPLPFAKLDWYPERPTVLRYLPTDAPIDLPSLTVSRAFSRAGVRLEGLPPSNEPERPSEPCCVGAIQQTPGGELIVIGPDGPTIGGYPRLGTVIEADLHLVPRLKIGQEVALAPVDFAEARSAAGQQGERLARLKSLLALNDRFSATDS